VYQKPSDHSNALNGFGRQIPKALVFGQLLPQRRPVFPGKFLLIPDVRFVVDTTEKVLFGGGENDVAQRLVKPFISRAFTADTFDKLGQGFFSDLFFDVFHRLKIVIDRAG
jgi:hypothetical protein